MGEGIGEQKIHTGVCAVGLTLRVQYKQYNTGIYMLRTSCGGISNEIVRRSTFTNESVHGMIQNSPTQHKHFSSPAL